MSGTPSSGGSSSSQLITSEQVLERLFRAGYERWIADARKRLGAEAASSAPRVVSKVFHLAWTDRSRFHSQEELDAFLGANIQHQSARELSRKASAHRLDKGGEAHKEHAVKEMTIDDAWTALKGTLSGGAPEALRQRASTARHEAAEHFTKIANRSGVNWKAIVAVFTIGIVAAVGGFWYVSKIGEDRAVAHALNAPDVRPYESSYGQQANITLDDSTVARIGPETKLIVPKLFGLGIRAVKVEGAANFVIRQTLEKPFEVRAGEAIIRSATGEFSVRRYKDDSALVVYARKGTVELTLGEVVKTVAEGSGILIPNNGGETRVPTSEELAEASSWVDGKVSIMGRDLRGALPQLKRWYGLNIHVEDTKLLDRKVFISASMTSQKEAIAAIEQSGGMTFTYIGENMAFKDTLPRGRRGSTKRP
jgi:ferric-dicitrate binding protein FerR (iron transport regulator)